MDLEWEEIKTLCYEDVTLLMLPNPEGKRDIIVMKRGKEETEAVSVFMETCIETTNTS